MLAGQPMSSFSSQDLAPASGSTPAMEAAGVRIRVTDLRHSYRTRRGAIAVLDGIDLTVPAGGYASLSGPSGAGKTTLLSLLGGLERPQTGSVVVGDVDLRTMDRDGLAAFRSRTVGFVFQHFGLLETLSARENIEFACMLGGSPRAERRRRADELLAAVRLADRGDHRPSALSGGERQRVAIARAIANEPALILADEPTGNLDERSATSVVELLESLRLERGMTLVVVTHHAELAARATDRFALAGGRLQAL
jgi:putative ABC transport system ATP-binding protein